MLMSNLNGCSLSPLSLTIACSEFYVSFNIFSFAFAAHNIQQPAVKHAMQKAVSARCREYQVL